jgi:hypothetical protein
MALKQTYKSARGKEIDMVRLVKQNEMAVAVGNAKVNARGDKLGPNGAIVKTREQIVSEQAGATIPNQINVRPQPAPEPEVKVAAQPTKKNIKDMDPEGNE